MKCLISFTTITLDPHPTDVTVMFGMHVRTNGQMSLKITVGFSSNSANTATSRNQGGKGIKDLTNLLGLGVSEIGIKWI